MQIDMKSPMMRIFTLCTSTFGLLLLLSTCSAKTVKQGPPVQNVDQKILEEFDGYRQNGKFYDAARSYIEFINCCSDARKAQLISGLTDLYKEKITNTKKEGGQLDYIEYTFSYINLMENEVPDGFPAEEIARYRIKLDEYIDGYLASELNSIGELQEVSGLLSLYRFSQNRNVILKLVELFLTRGNYVLAQKYLTQYEGLLSEEEKSSSYKALKQKLAAMKVEGESEADKSRNPIEETVKSSVKVVVDRGIKTKGGVGMPDQALGTGIVIDSRGYILTNYHIIESSVDPTYEGYSRIYIYPGKDETVKFVANVIGYDRVFDLALLKIETKIESRILMGDSDSLVQGEKVIAIGNPVGLTNTVTSGVVSSVDRPFLQLGGIIQIDAALNPGNSGGALINGEGYLVGVAFAGLENFENLNFAIPSEHILSVLHRLYDGGEVERSWIGCSLNAESGALKIAYIVPESPSSVCGLESGDVITEVNGKRVSTIYDVQKLIATMDNPLILNITIERDGSPETKVIYLDKRPVEPARYIYKHDAPENIVTPIFGLVLSKSESAKKKSYIIMHVLNGSVAADAGISEGDVIKLRSIKYDEDNKYFAILIDLKSKRFGYLDKSMALYQYTEVNTFI